MPRNLSYYNVFLAPVRAESSGATVYFSDSFDRANSSTIGASDGNGGVGGGGAGVTPTENNGDSQILSNKLRLPTTADSIVTWDVTGSADCVIRCRVKTDTGGSMFGVCARYQDASNYWRISLRQNSITLYERTAGVLTLRASATPVIATATDYTLKVTLSGTTISAEVEGVSSSSISYGSASAGSTRTKHGVHSEGTRVSDFDWIDCRAAT